MFFLLAKSLPRMHQPRPAAYAGNEQTPQLRCRLRRRRAASRNQGRYEEAEKMCRRALAGEERTLGKDHPETLKSISILASVLEKQGKYKDAEEMNRLAVDGRRKARGKKHLSKRTSLAT
ncbi:hypothetical protein MY11210_009457 [Beauveria gryllotalpidicola]